LEMESGGCLQELQFINSTNDNAFLEVGLYPNPVQDFVIFDKGALTDLGQVSIYDLVGNLVSEISILETRNKLDLSNLTNGYYTLLFSDKQGNTLGMSKIVKSN